MYMTVTAYNEGAGGQAAGGSPLALKAALKAAAQAPAAFALRAPRKSVLKLRLLRAEEEPEQASKYDAQDTFLGGDAFLRIRGTPIWLTDTEEVHCVCGREAEFIAAIGYENYDRPSGIVLPNRALFIGELALYFFACLSCLRVVVVSQPS